MEIEGLETLVALSAPKSEEEADNTSTSVLLQECRYFLKSLLLPYSSLIIHPLHLLE